MFPSVLFRWALSTNLSSGVCSSPWRGKLDDNWNRNLTSPRYKSQHTECAALHLQNTVKYQKAFNRSGFQFLKTVLYSIPHSAPLEDDTSRRSRGLSALHSTGSLCSTIAFLFLKGWDFPHSLPFPPLTGPHCAGGSVDWFWLVLSSFSSQQLWLGFVINNAEIFQLFLTSACTASRSVFCTYQRPSFIFKGLGVNLVKEIIFTRQYIRCNYSISFFYYLPTCSFFFCHYKWMSGQLWISCLEGCKLLGLGFFGCLTTVFQIFWIWLGRIRLF